MLTAMTEMEISEFLFLVKKIQQYCSLSISEISNDSKNHESFLNSKKKVLFTASMRTQLKLLILSKYQ